MRVDTFGTPCQSKVVGGGFEVQELVSEPIETYVLVDLLKGGSGRTTNVRGRVLPRTAVRRPGSAARTHGH